MSSQPEISNWCNVHSLFVVCQAFSFSYKDSCLLYYKPLSIYLGQLKMRIVEDSRTAARQVIFHSWASFAVGKWIDYCWCPLQNNVPSADVCFVSMVKNAIKCLCWPFTLFATEFSISPLCFLYVTCSENCDYIPHGIWTNMHYNWY